MGQYLPPEDQSHATQLALEQVFLHPIPMKGAGDHSLELMLYFLNHCQTKMHPFLGDVKKNRVDCYLKIKIIEVLITHFTLLYLDFVEGLQELPQDQEPRLELPHSL